jgi:hypothetical protein
MVNVTTFIFSYNKKNDKGTFFDDLKAFFMLKKCLMNILK